MENYNKKLLEYYSQWLKTIDKSFFAEHFSNPYFITAPTDWDNAKYRIMIIGEEGYGNWGAGKEDGWNPNEKTGIEKIMRYNEEYLKGQIIDKKNYKDYNSSAFWTRVRNIKDLDASNISIAWNNIDKFHHRRRKRCRLTSKERILLHQANCKILAEEIKILRPTHLVFFGWYFASLKAELPELHDELETKNWKFNVVNIDVAIEQLKLKTIFTYHPSWHGKNKPPEYEDMVLSEIKKSLQ